uniref:Family with sequence similarity 236, member D n=1 Tax=Mus musculus TaxID=10090 RepID=A0A1B0GSB3_MOUSE
MIVMHLVGHPQLTGTEGVATEGVATAHTMLTSRGPRDTREPAPPTRSWRSRFQRALARVSKFFRRGRRTARG